MSRGIRAAAKANIKKSIESQLDENDDALSAIWAPVKITKKTVKVGAERPKTKKTVKRGAERPNLPLPTIDEREEEVNDVVEPAQPVDLAVAGPSGLCTGAIPRNQGAAAHPDACKGAIPKVRTEEQIQRAIRRENRRARNAVPVDSPRHNRDPQSGYIETVNTYNATPAVINPVIQASIEDAIGASLEEGAVGGPPDTESIDAQVVATYNVPDGVSTQAAIENILSGEVRQNPVTIQIIITDEDGNSQVLDVPVLGQAGNRGEDMVDNPDLSRLAVPEPGQAKEKKVTINFSIEIGPSKRPGNRSTFRPKGILKSSGPPPGWVKHPHQHFSRRDPNDPMLAALNEPVPPKDPEILEKCDWLDPETPARPFISWHEPPKNIKPRKLPAQQPPPVRKSKLPEKRKKQVEHIRKKIEAPPTLKPREVSQIRARGGCSTAKPVADGGFR